MRQIFRVIRKKRNLRRLRAAVFLFLMFVEIFAHAQMDGQIFAAELFSPPVTQTSISNKGERIPAQRAIAIADDESQGSHQPFCQDEVSHHQGLLTGFSYSFDTASFSSERITSRRGEFVYNSLPPPYLPPKFS